MRDLNENQLKVIEQMGVNAETVILGTLILGGILSPKGLSLTPVLIGVTLYIGLAIFILWISRRRKEKE